MVSYLQIINFLLCSATCAVNMKEEVPEKETGREVKVQRYSGQEEEPRQDQGSTGDLCLTTAVQTVVCSQGVNLRKK